jgi:transcriptional regulator NrdR family protein
MACEKCGKQLTTYELYAIEQAIKYTQADVPHRCSKCQPILQDESEKRMDVIGQNGNEGLHYVN